MRAGAIVTQTKMEVLRTVRNKRFVIFTVLMPLAFYFIFVQQIGGNKVVDGANWNAYYMMSMASFGVIGGCLSSLGINVAQERVQGWVRLVRTTPLAPWAYLFAKLVAQLVLNLGIILAVFAAGGLVEGVSLTAGQWVQSALWIWLASLPFLVIGLVIGSVFQVNVAQVVASMVQLCLAMLGGLWTPLSVLGPTMRKIAEWLPTYHYAHVPWEFAAGRGMAWGDVWNLLAYLAVFVILSVVITRRQEAITS
jgi:ABC-2 type transport system permease protein